MRETDEAIYAKDAAGYLPVFNRYKIVLDHGEGVYVFDNNGRKYIDFLAGIAVNVLGHAYAPLVKTIAEQAGRMIHCSNLYYTQAQADAAERLVRLSARRFSPTRARKRTRVQSRSRTSMRTRKILKSRRSSRRGTVFTDARSRH